MEGDQASTNEVYDQASIGAAAGRAAEEGHAIRQSADVNVAGVGERVTEAKYCIVALGVAKVEKTEEKEEEERELRHPCCEALNVLLRLFYLRFHLVDSDIIH